jgi:hypothetical protein
MHVNRSRGACPVTSTLPCRSPKSGGKYRFLPGQQQQQDHGIVEQHEYDRPTDASGFLRDEEEFQEEESSGPE